MGAVLTTEMEWVNGVPVLRCRESYTKPVMNAVTHNVMALPFRARTDSDGRTLEEDAEYIGLTIGEAMMARQARAASYGDFEATQFFADRIMGKPKQSVESLTVHGTFQEYLDSLPDKAPPPPIDVKLLEATVEQPTAIKLKPQKTYAHLHLGEDL